MIRSVVMVFAAAAFATAGAPAAAQSADTFNLRGDIAVRGGDLARAFDDYSTAIRLNPFHARALRNRARVHFYRGDFAAAAEDFRIAGNADRANAYSLLWRYVAEARAGIDDRAGLADGLDRLRDGWPKPVVLHFLGRVSEEGVLAAAAADPAWRAARECEALFFLGQRHILAGEAAPAAASLRRAFAACPSEMVEHHAARVELARLGVAAQ